MGEIKKQSISNTLISYIGAVLGFLIIYVQPQLIKAEDIGLLRLLYSFSWMAATIMPFGIGTVTLRFFPRIKNPGNNHHGYFTLLLLIGSVSALLIGSLLYLNKAFFVEYYQKSSDFPEYFSEALGFAYVLSLISVYTLYTSSLLKTTFTVFLTDIFTRLGQLFLVVLYYYHWIDRNTLVLSYMGVFLIQLILMIGYLVKLKAVSFKINWGFYKTLPLKQIAGFALLMTFTAFASLGIKFMDQLMVGHFLDEKMLGIYATSVMMCVVMEIPFNSLDRIAQPKIASAWNIHNTKEVQRIYEMSSRYMFFIGAVLFCLLWAGVDLIFLYLPPEYQQGKMAFYIVSFSSLFNLVTGVNSAVIGLSDKYIANTFLLIVLIGVAFIANNLLIEPFGINGAAMATLLAIGAFNLLKYIYILFRFKMQPFTRHTLYIFISGLICISIILIIPSNWHPFFKALTGGFAVVIVFSALNIKCNTIEEINKLFKRFKLIK